MGDLAIQSDSDVESLEFDGPRFVEGRCRDGKVRRWNISTGVIVETRGIAETGREVRTVYTRDKAITATAQMPVKQTGENIIRLNDSPAHERARMSAGLGGTSIFGFSPDGTVLVAGSYDADLRVWRSRDGELLRLIDELPGSMFAFAFSPDGKVLATGGIDRIVYLWDTRTWKLTSQFTGQPEMISAMSFSPDGRQLITGGFSEHTVGAAVSILFWDAASGKVLRSVPAPRRVTVAVFSPDGASAATVAGRVIGIWDAPRLA